MRVLVTGGSGVIGNAVVAALVRHGHNVRLLSRHADAAADTWPAEVEACPGNVGDASTLASSCDDCAAVIHVAGIVKENPPNITFQNVNVEGTRNMLDAAWSAGVRRFVFISSLGAERGSSDYHASKLAGEKLVEASDLDWTIVRIGNVYGPGDEVISQVLTMVRTMPVVPSIGFGDDEFQPIWHEDAGEAIARIAERTDLNNRTLELAGDEITTMKQLMDTLEELTDRHPMRAPVPPVLARLGLRIASALGVDLPFQDNHVQMLIERNVVHAPDGNALTLLGVKATPLRTGLETLVDALPVKTPDNGVGPLEVKTFRARIADSSADAATLHRLFIDNMDAVMPVPVGAEPGTDDKPAWGATLTLHITGRGNIQVRCAELTDTALTLLTIEGHPLAGAVRFAASEEEGLVVFEITTFTRAANLIDRAALLLLGSAIQSRAWTQTVEKVVALSGGRAVDGVEHESVQLEGAEAEAVEEWVNELVGELERAEHEERLG